MTINNIWIVSSTFPNADEALSVASMLVEKQLVACVNISEGVTSVYRWQGGIQRETECHMLAKTSRHKVKMVIEALVAAHSYQLPAVTAWPVAEGYVPFLQWVEEETASA